MVKFTKVTEVGSNIAVMLLVGLVGWTLIASHLSRPPQATPAVNELKRGDVIHVAAETLTHDKNLVAVMSVRCIHCTRSLPMLAQIAKSVKDRAGVMAVFSPSDAPSQAKAFIDDAGVMASLPANVTSADFHIRGTPTFVLLDRRGKVLNVWVGELTGQSVDAIQKAI